jgi:hypothetical protein
MVVPAVPERLPYPKTSVGILKNQSPFSFYFFFYPLYGIRVTASPIHSVFQEKVISGKDTLSFFSIFI